MNNSFSNSWQLIKSSASILSQDKELTIFPILSSIGMTLLTVAFFLPFIMAGAIDSVSQSGFTWVHYVVLFVFYVIQYFIIIYSNTALVSAALIRIHGGDPTVGDGFHAANKRFGRIFLYAVISATVGVILSMIRDQGKTIGKIVVSIIGMVWNIATFLVVPILAAEDVGPVDAIKRSVAYMKKTWGEQLIGSYGISLVFNVIGFVFFLICAAAIALAVYFSLPIWVSIAIGAVLILVIMVISLISSTLNGIYVAAVYQYASTGEVGTFFDPGVIQGAFRTKTNKIGSF
jgi:hypothetical protein